MRGAGRAGERQRRRRQRADGVLVSRRRRHGTLTLNANGSFTYTPAANYNGTDSFTYKANDGTADSNVATVTITVTAVNDAPVVGQPYGLDRRGHVATITLSASDVDSASLTRSRSRRRAPTHGTLGAIGIRAARRTAGDQRCTATVTYTPAANYNGPDSFTYKANDGSRDSNVATVTITVTAVNDAPSFTKGADQTVLEDAGPQTVTGWATAISAGPAERERADADVHRHATTTPALFSVQPAIDADGTLTYTPAANANGTATVTVSAGQRRHGQRRRGHQRGADLHDHGHPVNDAPSFTKGADQTVLEDAGRRPSPAGPRRSAPAPADEAGQALTFMVTQQQQRRCSRAQPAIDADRHADLHAGGERQRHGHGHGAAAGQRRHGQRRRGHERAADLHDHRDPVNDAPELHQGRRPDGAARTPARRRVTGWATAISAGPADECGADVDASWSRNNNNGAVLGAAGDRRRPAR